MEYATDLTFRSAATLGPLYEQLAQQSVLNAKAEQVATFLGRQIHPVAGAGDRLSGVSFFKHHRKVEHRTGLATPELAPVKKSIYSLLDLREILFDCNRRYIAPRPR